MQSRSFNNLLVAVRRIFREGNFYPDDLNISQDLIKSSFQSICEMCISPGIYSVSNPKTNAGSLSISMVQGDTVKIEPGIAVFKDGTIFTLAEPSEFQFEFVDDDFTLDYVLCIMKIPDQTTATRYNMSTEGVDIVETGSIFELRLWIKNEYSLLSADELNSAIFLGALTKSAQPYQSYAINQEGTNGRPWFTWEDKQHKALKGSGTVADSNPHGLSFLDLDTLPGLSYWKLNDLTGFVSVIDQNDKNYGDIVEISIPPLSITNNYGDFSAAIFTLPKGAAYVLSVKEGDIYHNFKYYRNARQVTLYPKFPIALTLTVKVLLIHAGTVNLQIGSDSTLEIEAASDNEFVVFNNGLLPNFAGGTFSCNSLAGAALDYNFFIDPYGSIISNPQPILQTSLLQIGSGLYQAYALPQNAPLKIALNNFIVPATFNLVLKLKGTHLGIQVEETLTITNSGTGSNFNIPALSNLQNNVVNTLPGQWVTTTKSYTSLTSLEIVSASDLLPVETTIYIIQALTSISGLMPMARVTVSSKGQVTKISDIRDQKIGYGKMGDFLFYESFYNPIQFNPDNSTLNKEFALTDAVYESRPIYFLKGSYIIEVGVSSYDVINPPQVAILENYSTDVTVLTLLPFDNASGKLFYRVAFDAPVYKKVSITSPVGSGNKLTYLGIDLLTDTPSSDFGGPPVSGVLAVGPDTATSAIHLDSFNFSLTASGGTAPYSFSLLPGGSVTSAILNINPSTGLAIVTIPNISVSGIDGTVIARVVDAINQSATVSIPVVVPASQQSPSSGGQIYPTSYTAAVYSDTLSLPLSADGGTSPYIFSLMSGGTISNAVIYEDTLSIVGIPQTGVTGTLNIKVTDFNGLSDIYLINITVPAANYSIGITPINWTAPAYSTSLTFAITPVGGVPPYSVTLTTNGTIRPYASSFDNLITLTDAPITGVVGTLEVHVVDAHGISTQAMLNITVPPQ